LFEKADSPPEQRLEDGEPGVIPLLVLIGMLLGASPALAQGDLPAGFYGDWRGVAPITEEGGGDLEVTAEDLNVRIGPEGSGFRMYWTALTHEGSKGELVRQAVDARFEPTDRPGVFTFRPESSSLLLGLFGDPATNDPLEGEPLLWARFDGEALSVYGLVINAQGGFDLYQHVRALTDDGMAVHITHRTEHEPPMIIEGRLQRTGG
jgi:hypothetical protein